MASVRPPSHKGTAIVQFQVHVARSELSLSCGPPTRIIVVPAILSGSPFRYRLLGSVLSVWIHVCSVLLLSDSLA